jgi:hypothetical protein
MTSLAALAIALSALAADVTVKPLSGEPIEGRLTGLTTQEVTVETSSGQQRLAASDVMVIELPAEPSNAKPAIWVDLLDGSKLHAEAFTAASGKASVQLSGGVKLEVPTRSILSVRFAEQDAELAHQWRAIVTGERNADLIVVRKRSMRTVEDGDEPQTVTEEALDVLDGALLEVGPESVKFDFAGDNIDVKREKIEGLVYYQRAGRELPAPVCRLVDASGSQWALKSLELAGQTLTVVTAAGASAQLPLSAVAKIDFSVGNIAHLAELEPDTGDGEPLVSLQPAAMTARFGRIFKVSRQPPLGADGFRIAGQRYDNGLSLHSPAALVYRVPEGFRKLHAVAGVDDSIVAPGQFVLQILGDGKELARHEFRGQEQRGPVTIDLDLAGVRRISIVVDPGDGQDIGDQLNLCEARLTK